MDEVVWVEGGCEEAAAIVAIEAIGAIEAMGAIEAIGAIEVIGAIETDGPGSNASHARQARIARRVLLFSAACGLCRKSEI